MVNPAINQRNLFLVVVSLRRFIYFRFISFCHQFANQEVLFLNYQKLLSFVRKSFYFYNP